MTYEYEFQSNESPEERISIVETATAEAYVAVPGTQYLPAKEDAPLAPVATEENDEPIKVQFITNNFDSSTGSPSVRVELRENEPLATEVVKIGSTPSAPINLAPKVSIETNNLDKILSRQYLTPLLTGQETKVVQPSHTYTEENGYSYQLPVKSFVF